MNDISKTLGIIPVVASSTFLSGFAAVFGAKAGGLEEGGWNWQLLPPLVYGWIGGFVACMVCLAVSVGRGKKYSTVLFMILFAPVLLAFCVSATCYTVGKSPNPQRISAKLKTSPEALRSLIAKAGTAPLSKAEHRALWDMVWVSNSIHAGDISFLIDYFGDDGSALGGIITRQSVTSEHLRYLYERHKHAKEYSRVLDELAGHPLTPVDVLQALTLESNKLVVVKAQDRLAKKK